MNRFQRLKKQWLESHSCSEVLGEAVRIHPGVVCLRFDYRRNLFEMEYDRSRLSRERAEHLSGWLSRELSVRIPTCRLRDRKGLCEDCLEVEKRGKTWVLPSGDRVAASFRESALEIQRFPRQEALTDRVVRRVKASEEKVRWWQSRTFWEPLLAGLTLLFLLLGRLALWLKQPAWLATGCFTAAYLAGGYFGVKDSLKTLRERRLDVNILMILAALGAAWIGEAPEGATLLFLFALSNTLQGFALARSRRALRALMALKPETATVLRDGIPEEIPTELLQVGELVLVKPGERIAADGKVERGESYVDQAPITGESLPVLKEPGSTVYAGSLNGHGILEIRVTQPPEQTLLARIMELVEQAQEQKARTQRWLEVFEQRYALAVIGGALLLAFLLPLLLGWRFEHAFYRAMTLLVVASPCALVISTPATLLSAIANAARHGVLLKGGEPLERLAAVKVVAFDKTGTLTEGRLNVTNLLPIEGSEAELWQALIDVESLSEHPLAKALAEAARAKGFQAQPVEQFQALPGKGVVAKQKGGQILIGNLRLFQDYLDQEVPEPVEALISRLQGEGKVAMAVYSSREGKEASEGSAGRWLGVVAVADTLRPSARQAIEALKALKVAQVVMLTGDSKPIAQAIAARLGLHEVYAELLPDEKLSLLKQLESESGPVAMVGDGINDAPSLAAATVGIAMGKGTDVALETADVVLLGNDLQAVPYALLLARQAMRVLKQNLAFALAVILTLVILTFAIGLRMPLGVVGHEGSTLLVVLNGLRLLGFREIHPRTT